MIDTFIQTFIPRKLGNKPNKWFKSFRSFFEFQLKKWRKHW